jgi:hypothetical protein
VKALRLGFPQAIPKALWLYGVDSRSG